MSNDDIKAHFEQFGEVVEVVRPVDKQKNNEPKTFCFITFAKEDAAKQLVKQVFKIHLLRQKKCNFDCKCSLYTLLILAFYPLKTYLMLYGSFI